MAPKALSLDRRDDRDTLLIDSEAGRPESVMLCLANSEAKYFSSKDWTRGIARRGLICPIGQFARKGRSEVLQIIRFPKATAGLFAVRIFLVMGFPVECGRGAGHDFFGSNCARDRMMKASVWLMSSIGT